MTLNGAMVIILRYLIEFGSIASKLETKSKWLKSDPYTACLRQNVDTKSSFWQYMTRES